MKAAGIRDVSYEQFHLTPIATLRKMIDAARTRIHLSPEPHDREISRLAGRGMTKAKQDAGMLPGRISRELRAKRAAQRELLFRVSDLWEREGTEAVVRSHGDEIRAFDEAALRAGVADRVFPIPRALDNRWFDEFEIT